MVFPGSPGASRSPDDDFRPSHVVPAEGLPAWDAPDPGRPTVPLDPFLPVQLLERIGDWGRVLCSNGWSAWVDGRLLVSVPPEPPAAGQPMGRAADPRPLLARAEEAVSRYRLAAEDLAAGRVDGEVFRRRTQGLRIGLVVDGEALWMYDARRERWLYCDGARLVTYAASSGPSTAGTGADAGAEPPPPAGAGPPPPAGAGPAAPSAPPAAETAVLPAAETAVVPTPQPAPATAGEPPGPPGYEPTRVVEHPPPPDTGPEPTRVAEHPPPPDTGPEPTRVVEHPPPPDTGHEPTRMVEHPPPDTGHEPTRMVEHPPPPDTGAEPTRVVEHAPVPDAGHEPTRLVDLGDAGGEDEDPDGPPDRTGDG
ncbi:hypothetical protein ACF068_10095 [Streptomyces sp. NPDC016309]|uniref:hypothetical protein n=1 Tax=Streptomyces sp. NPDC016309 TaxID=3364965 RepID=UPI0036FFADA2